MSAETLRKAASEMREHAARGIAWDGDYAADKGWLAPPVALAVADWLDRSAETWERLEEDLRGLEGAPTIERVYGYDFTEALAVATAYLGGDQ